MADDKKTENEPTPRERKTAFAPHQEPAPEQQADGDPGNETPGPVPEQTEAESDDSSTDKTAGKRGQWDKGA